MRTRSGGLAFLAVGLTALVSGPGGSGQPTAPAAPKPVWVYAHDLRVRKGGDKDFTKDTPKIGVEVFRDDAAAALVGITQAGNLTVSAGATVGAEKKAAWLFAHDLRARKGDEDKFTMATAKFGVEVFRDTASGKLLYVGEKGTVSLADPPATVATDKEPAWHHALILKVRPAGETDFAKAKKFGVEAFKDGNTGGLVYITETGAIATAPAPASPPAPDQVKAPKAQYGLELRVRKSDEPDFTEKTKKIGVEVFKDENTGGLVYISETGSIAAAPFPAAITTGKSTTWRHAMTLKARPGGVSDFKQALKYGVEVFRDNNSGHLVYISETGSIAVLPQK